MINRKRSSVGLIDSHTYLQISATIPPPKTSTTTATGTVEFSTFYRTTGSGSIVKHNKRTSFILTAAHVCTVAYESQIKSIFPFYDKYKYKVSKRRLSELYDVTGKRHPAIPLVWNVRYDICIMVAPKINQRALSLAYDEPYLGEKVYYMGFPRSLGGGKFVPAFEGFYLGTMPISNRDRGAVAGYSVPIAPGSSGSSVLNIFGDIVGMVHSYYPVFENIGLSATHRQLKDLFEKAEKTYEKRRKKLLADLEAWL